MSLPKMAQIHQGAGERGGRLRLDAQQAGGEIERVDDGELFLPMFPDPHLLPL
jgi:hypothetical protein